MTKYRVILERLNLSRLTIWEQYLYKLVLLGENCKLQMYQSSDSRKKREYQKFINSLETILPSDWGMIVFKPPRASSLPLCQLLEKELRRLLKLYNLYLLGSLCVQNLTMDHIRTMYPGDMIMPYWKDLKETLIGNAATYYLFRSHKRRNISAREIDMIKGWYHIDVKRRHYIEKKGLRSFYYREVVKKEGMFPFTTIESAKYEDSGIHAPCSLLSRFFQLLSFMAVDSNGAKWVRSCFSGIKNNPAR